jgi:hypothetical protein
MLMSKLHNNLLAYEMHIVYYQSRDINVVYHVSCICWGAGKTLEIIHLLQWERGWAQKKLPLHRGLF